MDTPLIDFKSVKDLISEAWNCSLDLLGSLAMSDFDLTFDEDEDF